MRMTKQCKCTQMTQNVQPRSYPLPWLLALHMHSKLSRMVCNEIEACFCHQLYVYVILPKRICRNVYFFHTIAIATCTRVLKTCSRARHVHYATIIGIYNDNKAHFFHIQCKFQRRRQNNGTKIVFLLLEFSKKRNVHTFGRNETVHFYSCNRKSARSLVCVGVR